MKSLNAAVPGDDKHQVIAGGGGHGTSLFEFGDRGTRLSAELDRFLKRTPTRRQLTLSPAPILDQSQRTVFRAD